MKFVLLKNPVCFVCLPAICCALVFAANSFGAPRPVVAKAGDVFVARTLKDFEGHEEPGQRFIVATRKFERFGSDKPAAITESAPGVFHFALRYHAGEWWDGDRTTTSKDRQRAEVKGLGPHPMPGDTIEYKTTWRTSDSFRCGGKFCHVMQLKALDGDNGAPLVVMTVMPDNKYAAVRICSGKDSGFTIVRQFPWTPGKWMTVAIRITTSTGNSDKTANGAVLVSVNGDEFQGKSGIPLYRPNATSYRPKFGLYRGVNEKMKIGDDWVEHKDVSATVVAVK